MCESASEMRHIAGASAFAGASVVVRNTTFAGAVALAGVSAIAGAATVSARRAVHKVFRMVHCVMAGLIPEKLAFAHDRQRF